MHKKVKDRLIESLTILCVWKLMSYFSTISYKMVVYFCTVWYETLTNYSILLHFVHSWVCNRLLRLIPKVRFEYFISLHVLVTGFDFAVLIHPVQVKGSKLFCVKSEIEIQWKCRSSPKWNYCLMLGQGRSCHLQGELSMLQFANNQWIFDVFFRP